MFTRAEALNTPLTQLNSRTLDLVCDHCGRQVLVSIRNTPDKLKRTGTLRDLLGRLVCKRCHSEPSNVVLVSCRTEHPGAWRSFRPGAKKSGTYIVITERR